MIGKVAGRVGRLRAKLQLLSQQGSTSGERAAAAHLLERLDAKYFGGSSTSVATTPDADAKGPVIIYWGDIRTHDPVTGEVIGKAGHHAWLPRRGAMCYEWASPYLHIRAHDAAPTVLPGPFALHERRADPELWQIQGDLRFTTQTIAGLVWSVLAWWDRTGDRRYASNSQIWMHGKHSLEDVAAAAVAAFPEIARRQIPGTQIGNVFGMALALSAPASTRVFYLPGPDLSLSE